MLNRTYPALADGIVAVIGHTPLVQLRRVLGDGRLSVTGKLEASNPGGSIKDRPAFQMLRRAIDSGQIDSHTLVIESSSGNMGVGLAMACAFFGMRFRCVVDPKTTSQNIRLLEAYGAEVDLVKAPDPATGEYLQARLSRVNALLEATPNSFWPNQYSNPDNPLAHRQTMQEIINALDGDLDYFFCATSTCGTLRGCAEYIRERGLSTRVIGVDAVGSVIFGGKRAKRLIPGHGAAVRPPLYRSGLADQVVLVSDLECIIGCRRLAQTEAILAGGSSGAVIAALARMQSEIPDKSSCALILADRGERYLDTIYSDEWVRSHFGDVSTRWEELAGNAASTPLGTETSSHCQPVSADALKSETSKLEFV